MAETPDNSTTITGVQLIVLITFVPIVIVWLILAWIIIRGATTNPETLGDIEGLLAALSILGNPVIGGMGYVMGAFANEQKGKGKLEAE
jgi:hypothetical protein